MSEGFAEGTLLRIFVGEADLLCGIPVFEEVVKLALDAGFMGATVLRGIESFGQTHQIHTARLLRLSENLPVVIEIVDEPSRVDSFVKTVDGVFKKAGCGGLITVEKVSMRKYKGLANN